MQDIFKNAGFGWWVAGLIALAGCGSQNEPATSAAPPPEARHVGSAACAGCHAEAYAAWQGSHHALAMQTLHGAAMRGDVAAGLPEDTARPDTALRERGGALYVVTTDGQDDLREFAVRYTFGVEPLQQYLLDAGGGRLQAWDVAWDDRPGALGGQRWYALNGPGITPQDPLHWTRHGANWNQMCADCHSTAVVKGYDRASDVYATEYAEISVGCEACHGPGSLHVSDPADPAGFAQLDAPAAEIGVCAQCHSRRSQLVDGFVPGDDYFDHYRPAMLDQGLYHVDGQILDEVFVYGSFLQSRMHGAGVTCSNCHEPHSAELRISGDGVCTQCHSPAGNPQFPSAPRADFAAAAHHLHEPDSPGSRCVSCHMPAKVYMGVDARRDHSFRIPRPDLSASLGVPDACAACHDEAASWSVAKLAEVGREPRGEHFAHAFAAARRGEPRAEQALVDIAADEQQPVMVRATALSLMAAYQQGGSARQLQIGLAAADPLLRLGALRGAQRFGAERRWRLVRPLLDDPVLAVRTEAVQSLLSVYSALTPARQQGMASALAEYRETLAFSADTPEGLSNLAGLHMIFGEIPQAERALRDALAINPQWVPGLVNLADLLRATGRDHQGGSLLAEAVQLTADMPDVLVARALWLVRQGEAASALPLLEQAWDLDESNADSAYVYAVALNSLGQPAEALSVVERTLSRRADPRLLQLKVSLQGAQR